MVVDFLLFLCYDRRILKRELFMPTYSCSRIAQIKPNPDQFAERVKPIRHLVVHSFALSVSDMLTCLAQNGISSHYIIDTDGQIMQLVPEDKVAWHAGKSFWRGESGLNASSIGIELQNPTLGQTPFPKAQIEAFSWLARGIIERHRIDPRLIVTHSDIAPTRKVDVGKAFPWAEVAKDGIGLWCDSADVAPTEDVAQALAQIGYDISDVDKALLAFERRFMPEVVPTEPDIMQMETHLVEVKPVDTPAVRRRLAQIAALYSA